MNLLLYMQTVKNINSGNIAKNNETISVLTEQLSEAQQISKILSENATACDQVIAILSQQT